MSRAPWSLAARRMGTGMVTVKALASVLVFSAAGPDVYQSPQRFEGAFGSDLLLPKLLLLSFNPSLLILELAQ